ncbi:MAG: SLBB domain-containing protein [Candidatus Aminicenantes bacterium]|nr:MAG: SLBB domain-containing protein [Candidatus Aminicenantes bacterium]
MIKSKYLITGLLGFLLISFPAAINSQDEFVYEYKIGPSDLLQLTVIGFDDLNRQYRVSEDGSINLPYLGETEVGGLTRGELEDKVSRILQEKNFIKDPQVSVHIVEYMSKRIYLLGAVENTGPYELLGRMTLLKLLSQAGGLSPDAGNQIIVTRQLPDGEKTTLRIPVDELLLETNASLDIPLQPDDIINVPADKIVFIYVTGQVNNPGALEVRSSNIPTLLRAIAKAGGFAEKAAKGRVRIKRTNETGEEIEIKVDVGAIMKGKEKDVQLQADDVIIVPEKWF